MCIDFPGQVVERLDDTAIIECGGRRRRASTLLHPDLRVGDWVYVAAGTVVERLDPEAAHQIFDEIAIVKGVDR